MRDDVAVVDERLYLCALFSREDLVINEDLPSLFVEVLGPTWQPMRCRFRSSSVVIRGSNAINNKVAQALRVEEN
ncbi:MAG: hypothetical protein EA405_11795 [Rhodospirillales bacterium]|nr:MAG: hypothetical protein EA405_11795 [Rhodospirillales bacterium]